MKMRELVDALPAMRKIACQDLGARTLYKVALLLDRFEAELKAYDETRIKLLQKYCDEIDGAVVPRKETEAEFESEMIELLETEIDTDGMKVVEIPAEENIRISYTDLRQIGKFIKIKLG